MAYHYKLTLSDYDCAILKELAEHSSSAEVILKCLMLDKVEKVEFSDGVTYHIPEHVAWQMNEVMEEFIFGGTAQYLTEDGYEAMQDFWNSIV